VRRPLGRGGRTLIAAAVLASSVGAWWSGALPCAAVTAQPACQLAVSGGPVLDTARLLSVMPSGAERAQVAVREPAGRLLVTTIEVWELDGVGAWRDPHVDLVARVRLVPAGGDLDDVAEAGRARMEESQVRAVGLALAALGLIAGPDVPSWAWPVEVSFATDEVGGPSAGLMLAVGVVARLAPVDPTARTDGAASGRPPLRVAGTGALEADGRVVGVGGVDHKLRRAVADAGPGGGLDAFLLPSDDLPVARRTDVKRDVLLVPVRDLDGALAALAALASGSVPQDAELLSGTEGRAR